MVTLNGCNIPCNLSSIYAPHQLISELLSKNHATFEENYFENKNFGKFVEQPSRTKARKKR
jgi:hypothetical protein